MKRLRVLVLDADKRQALAACRGLGRADHDVGAAGYQPSALAGWSRYTRRYHRLPSPRGATDDFGAALRALTTEQGYDVVVAVEDPTVAALVEAGLEIPTVPRLGTGLERLVDKVALAGIAAAAGVAYPPTEVLDGPTHAGVLERLGAPAVVKPARSAVALDGRVSHHSGAAVTPDPAAVADAAETIGRQGLVPIAQERIERADKINVTIFRRSGISEVRFPYRVLRDVPLTGGIAVTLETVSAEQGIGANAVAALELVCDEAGYEGIANGEFCLSARDGRLYLIEVNTRPWGSLWFAERLGQRVADRAVRHAVELPSAPSPPARAGRRYHNPAGELRWVLRHASRRRPLLSVVRSTRPWDVFEYVDPADPVATLRYAVAKLSGRYGGPDE
jgi:predicted ATP-grasp superfamily ATP-dependent carboligase